MSDLFDQNALDRLDRYYDEQAKQQKMKDRSDFVMVQSHIRVRILENHENTCYEFQILRPGLFGGRWWTCTRTPTYDHGLSFAKHLTKKRLKTAYIKLWISIILCPVVVIPGIYMLLTNNRPDWLELVYSVGSWLNGLWLLFVLYDSFFAKNMFQTPPATNQQKNNGKGQTNL